MGQVTTRLISRFADEFYVVVSRSGPRKQHEK